tara:strand:+ start:924 stop:1421 length:498 start_codon:yes stop_codon:yes gene_type:complete
MYARVAKPSDHWLTQPETWIEFSQIIQKEEIIWEPFVCEGHAISTETWRKNGFGCIQTNSDFFHTIMPESTTCLISNPPFSKKFDVLEKCFQSKIRFALLLPVWVFASSTFRKLLKKYVVQELALIVPSKRVHYINPTTLKVMNKTNFDSIFLSCGIVKGGLYYL